MICTKCQQDKAVECFSKLPAGNYKSWCLACVAFNAADWRRRKKAGLLKVRPPKPEPTDETLSPRERRAAKWVIANKSIPTISIAEMNRMIQESK